MRGSGDGGSFAGFTTSRRRGEPRFCGSLARAQASNRERMPYVKAFPSHRSRRPARMIHILAYDSALSNPSTQFPRNGNAAPIPSPSPADPRAIPVKVPGASYAERGSRIARTQLDAHQGETYAVRSSDMPYLIVIEIPYRDGTGDRSRCRRGEESSPIYL